MGQLDNYLLNRALKTNPYFAKQYFEEGNRQAQQKKREQYISSLMGKAPTPDLYVGNDPAGQLMQQGLPGTGYLGGGMSRDELAFKLLQAPTQSSRSVGQNLFQNIGEDPITAREYMDMPDDQRGMYDRFHGRTDKTPTDILEFRAFQAMSPAEQQNYMKLNSVGEWVLFGNTLVHSVTGETRDSGSVDKIIEDERAKQDAIASDPKVRAENVATHIDNINRFEMQKKQLGDMYGLASSPFAVGLGSSQASKIDGSNAHKMMVLIQSFGDQAFLANLKKMKGYGSLSGPEGGRLESAYGKIVQGLGEEDFRENIQTIFALLKKIEAAESAAYKKDEQRYKSLTGENGSSNENLGVEDLLEKYK